jgi:hypothetical protein
MSRKKISTTIYVTPEQNDQLKLLHARTKVPIAVYIREGIDLVLSNYAHLLPGQLALAATQDVRSPPATSPDTAEAAASRASDGLMPRARQHVSSSDEHVAMGGKK